MFTYEIKITNLITSQLDIIYPILKMITSVSTEESVSRINTRVINRKYTIHITMDQLGIREPPFVDNLVTKLEEK
jgi:hypothetical protein